MPAASAASTFSLVLPTGSTRAAQRDLSSHDGICPHDPPTQERGQCHDHRNARAGPSFGVAPAERAGGSPRS